MQQRSLDGLQMHIRTPISIVAVASRVIRTDRPWGPVNFWHVADFLDRAVAVKIANSGSWIVRSVADTGIAKRKIRMAFVLR